MRGPEIPWWWLFALLTLALIFGTAGCGCGDDDDDDDDDDGGGDDDGPVESAEDFVERVVKNAEADDVWQAFVGASAFDAAVVVDPAMGGGDEAPAGVEDPWLPDAEEEAKSSRAPSASSKFTPDGDYWFAFVDPHPFAQFEHDVTYTFVDSDTGAREEEPALSWPEVDGEAVYVSGKDFWRVYGPGTPPDDYAAPSKSAAKTLTGSVYAVISPSWTDNTATIRFLIGVDGADKGTRTMNVVVDNDRDGAWGAGARGAEWLVKNAEVELTGGEQWVWTDPVLLPTDSDGKFGYRNWTRVSIGASKISGDDWDGSGAENALDAYFNFLPWGAPGFGAGEDRTGVIGPDEPPLEPLVLEKSAKAVGTYYCWPDEVDIPIERKALVINMGDLPGNSWMDRNARRAEMGFNLILGDGAATRLDRPTAAEALAAIKTFLTDLKCLDENWIYITGHGGNVSGQILSQNDRHWLSYWDIADHLNATSKNCPRVMNDSKNECRQSGYCNLNFLVQSCYSGWWQKTDTARSLRRWGVNILTSAAFDKTSYGRDDGDGSYVSNAFWNGFFMKEADQSANGGNGDGVVSPKEAMLYARDRQEGPHSGSTTAFGGNCDCRCEECAWHWGDRLVDLKFYAAKAEGPAYVDFMDIDYYSIEEAGGDYTVTISYAGDLPQPGDSGFYEFYAVFDADPAWTNESADSPTFGGDSVYIASFQSGAWGNFLFNRSTGTWTQYASTMTSEIDGNALVMHIDGAEVGLDLGETISWQVATWSRDASNADFGDVTDSETFTPPVVAAFPGL